MAHQDIHDELVGLFAAEDEIYLADREPFVADVEQRIGRRVWQRRAVLAGATFCGSLIAAVQAPEILMLIGDYSGFGQRLVDNVGVELGNIRSGLVALGAVVLVSMLTALSADMV